jgi:hypothetical protein
MQVSYFAMPLHPPDSNSTPPLDYDGKQPTDLAQSA